MHEQAMATGRRVGRRVLGIGSVGALLLVYACGDRGPTLPTSLPSDGHAAHARPGGATHPEESNPAAMLAAVRQATARYHDLAAAIADGYVLGYKGLVTGCVALPGTGAMGYHYFNQAKMDDPAIVADDPEVLVYHSVEGGALRLGAVEWVVPKALWEAAGNTGAPVVHGQTLHILNPVLNWYIQHAWVWTPNPSGIFADWNPNVSCP